MADDLAKMWENLSISDEEGEVMEIKNHSMINLVNWGQLCLVGKLMTERLVSKETTKSKLI